MDTGKSNKQNIWMQRMQFQQSMIQLTCGEYRNSQCKSESDTHMTVELCDCTQMSTTVVQLS